MCEGIKSSHQAARLWKVRSKDHNNGLGTLKKDDESYTADTQENFELMVITHIPEIPLHIELIRKSRYL